MSITDWRQLHGSHFDRTRVLVTGGAGFIGSHITEALLQLGATVVVLDDLSGGDEGNFDTFRPTGDRLHFVRGTILDQNLVNDCVRGCKYVFHLAALGSVPGSIDQPRKYHDVNVTGTVNVLEASRAAGVQRVMFAASAAGYGDSEELPKIETMPSLAKSPYAANKIACEALMMAYAASFPIDTAPLRYFNVFGPRQNANSAYAAVIAAFAKALFADKHPVIFGDGEQSRDFVFVENIVHANLLAARCTKPIKGQIINIACGTRISVNRLAQVMAEAAGKPHLTAQHKPERAGDVKHSQADISRARAVLGYQPIVGFEEGLRPTVEWYGGVLVP